MKKTHTRKERVGIWVFSSHRAHVSYFGLDPLDCRLGIRGHVYDLSVSTSGSDQDNPLPVKLTRRKRGIPNKFKESTIHEITKEIPRNIEKITPPHTILPWRTGAQDKRYAFRLTTNPARRDIIKGEAADEHRTRITQLSQYADYIII